MWSDRGLAAIDVVVLAGGLGTRIRDVLGDTPKVLAPVGNQPFLAHFLNHLSTFGARRVVMCLGHLAEKVTDWLDRNELPAGMTVDCSIEPAPMGTAGALRHAASLIGSEPVLVVNGDTFVDADLAAFAVAHAESGAAGSLLCVEVDDASRYGRVEIGEGRIQRFTEKAPGAGTISAGVYLLSRSLFDDIAASQATSLERDVLERLPPGTLAATVLRGGRFIDIGTTESLAAAPHVIIGGGG